METPTTPASAANPLSSKHQKFVEAITSGVPHRTAYKSAYPNASLNTAEGQAWRLLQRPDIQAELGRLRSQSETAAVLSLQERREYLARVVRTPATEVSPTSNADLIQEIKISPDGQITFHLPDKIRALLLDSRLAGDLSPTTPKSRPRSKDDHQHQSEITAALEILRQAMFTHPSPQSADACPTECEAQRRAFVPPSATPIPPAPSASPPPRSLDVLVSPPVATPTPPASPQPMPTLKPKPNLNKTCAEQFLSQFHRGTPQIDLSSLPIAAQKALLGTKWKPDFDQSPAAP